MPVSQPDLQAAPRTRKRLPGVLGGIIIASALVGWFGYLWWISGVLAHEEKYPDGKIKCLGVLKRVGWQEYKRHGVWTTYHANGQLESQGRYDRGHPVGKWTYFDAEGKQIRTEEFSPPSR